MDNNELYHYGVKGMKWDVRKDRQKHYSSKGRTNRTIIDKNGKKHEYTAITVKPSKGQKQSNTGNILRAIKKGEIRASDVTKYETNGHSTIQHIINQQLNQQQIDIAIRDANRVASLGISGGTNPFMFG